MNRLKEKDATAEGRIIRIRENGNHVLGMNTQGSGLDQCLGQFIE